MSDRALDQASWAFFVLYLAANGAGLGWVVSLAGYPMATALAVGFGVPIAAGVYCLAIRAPWAR